MNRGLLLVVLAALVLVSTAMVQAQNRVEGSRPGQTYRVGESAAREDNTDQAQPPEAQQPYPQYQMNPQLSPQELQQQVRMKDAAGMQGNVPVILEFSDLQCPDSARYNANLKNQVMQRYVSSGRASYEWHDFPLPSHAQAQMAAASARCAGQAADQVRQRIMANQGEMSETVFAGYARQAGADPDQVASCLREGRTIREVMSDKALGESLGVRGTPTLVIATRDGRGRLQPLKVVKAYNPPQQVLAEIDSALMAVAQPAVQGDQPGVAPGYPAGVRAPQPQAGQPMPQTY